MNPRTSFLTGATGFLGSSLAVELLQRDRERIYCLVRPHGDVHERLRGAVVAAAEAAGVAHLVEDRLDRLVPLAGDIAAEDLGLSDEARAILAAAPADECWHSAASLRYEDRHKDEIVGTNVDGTRHLLDAIAKFRASSDLREIFGDAFVDLYSDVKAGEHDAYQQVISPWERQHLLLNV